MGQARRRVDDDLIARPDVDVGDGPAAKPGRRGVGREMRLPEGEDRAAWTAARRGDRIVADDEDVVAREDLHRGGRLVGSDVGVSKGADIPDDGDVAEAPRAVAELRAAAGGQMDVGIRTVRRGSAAYRRGHA